jgi:hypothetical protein
MSVPGGETYTLLEERNAALSLHPDPSPQASRPYAPATERSREVTRGFAGQLAKEGIDSVYATVYTYSDSAVIYA